MKLVKQSIAAIALFGLSNLAFSQTKEIDQPIRDHFKKEMELKKKEKLDQMAKNLNLNSQQIEQIGQIQESNKLEMKKMRDKQKEMGDANREQMKNNREQMEAQIKTILSPEQFLKWKQMKQEQKSNMKGRFQERKSKTTQKETQQ